LALQDVLAPGKVLAMSRALAPIADKVGKLLRLLTSDHDGEVVAAARKLNRALEQAGLDMHDLADGLANGERSSGLPDEAEVRKIYQRGYLDGRRAEQEQQVWQLDDEPSWHEIARECQAKAHKLRGDRERQFVENMVRRTVRGGRLTEPQEKWLRDIYARVRR
jgi:hypothetical protein